MEGPRRLADAAAAPAHPGPRVARLLGGAVAFAVAFAVAVHAYCERDWYFTWRVLRWAGLRVLEWAPLVLGVAGGGLLALRRPRAACLALLLACAAAWAFAAGYVAFRPFDEPPLGPAWWVPFLVPAAYALTALALAAEVAAGPRLARWLFRAGLVVAAVLVVVSLASFLGPRTIEGWARAKPMFPRNASTRLLGSLVLLGLHGLGRVATRGFPARPDHRPSRLTPPPPAPPPKVLPPLG